MLRNLGIMDKLARLKAGADMETLLAELAEEKAAAEQRIAEQKAAEAEEAEPTEEEITEAEEAEETPAELAVEGEDTT
jgi:hypothetical protein